MPLKHWDNIFGINLCSSVVPLSIVPGYHSSFQTRNTVPLVSLVPHPVSLSFSVYIKRIFPLLPSCRHFPFSSQCGLTGLPSPQPVVNTATLDGLSVQKLS